MKEEIVSKIRKELAVGVKTEQQVLYVLAEIRKLIEGENLKQKYFDLNFHCDWVLHSALDRAGAKAVLAEFDEAQPLFKAQMNLHEFPGDLQRSIRRISGMKYFKEDLTGFLEEFKLPPLTLHRSDGWVHFIHLYTQVIQNVPLIATNSTKNISKITVHFEMAKESIKHDYGEEMMFKVTWRIFDKNGESGDFYLLNSFSLTDI